MTLSFLDQFDEAALASASVAVIGDICIDHYYFTDSAVSEISVETGLETVSVKSSEYYLGGAGNVAETLRTLGVGKVDLYGVSGSDTESAILEALCKECGISISGIIVQKTDWQTNMYHKIIKDGKELPRFDLGNFNVVSEATQNALLEKLDASLSEYRCIIVNEQLLSGLTTDRFIRELNKRIASTSGKIMWLVDTRHRIGSYENVVYKMNEREALAYYNGKTGSERSIEKAVASLSARWNRPIAVTLGKEGALAVQDGKSRRALGIDFTQPIDTVGAGDAFIASMAAALVSGLSFFDAVDAANLGASASVLTMYRTGHPSLSDMRSVAHNAMFRYHPEIASYTEKPRTLPDSHIEIIDEAAFENRRVYPQVAIFDHDGTISVLRQGWESVMEAVMVEAVTPDASADEELRKRITADVKELIDKTTGIQTIIQMQLLIPIIEKYGLVKTVRSAEDYKAIFVRRLKQSMQEKVDALSRGELNTDDVTIKGARDFLQTLFEAGTKLYLASGSDHDDVVREAELLGYAHLFTGGICGSVGDPKNDPKKIVIQKIIKELAERGISPEGCAVFGDGPVEMREAHENGFFAVGVLSDEKQRFGVNRAKRARLVLAGADVLIPDFSQIRRIYGGA
ncbi:PfkB family carbohydrate kinase [Treponema socranskii]|uniref:PfkB family carbohydrate kinase n=1 Tax=Treponema socranskii TaxID=53419 RepID=UPI003D6F004B